MTKDRKPGAISAYLLALIAALFTIAIIVYPQETFEASLQGLKLWWDVVLPALLPFFIISEILMGLGVVHFMGALLEPLMRPLFKVPGVGGFVVAIGLASGYPIGAKITSRLRQQEMCTKLEAERLVCFTNTADPLFMIGAVAVGMFHNVALGATIAAAHYISSIMVGLTMRFWGKDRESGRDKKRPGNLFSHGLQDLYEARKKDGRPIGRLLGEAVTSSMNTILLVGGFIILFSVLVKVMVVTGLVQLLSLPLVGLLKSFQTGAQAIPPLVSGIFEITLGAHEASIAALNPRAQLVLTSSIIAWSGLSVHGQVAALISSTDMRYAPYFFARILHGVYAGLVTYFIYNPAREVFLASPALWQPFGNFWSLTLELLQARVFTISASLAVMVVLAWFVRSLRVGLRKAPPSRS